jgi:hypothetical protein
MGEIILNTCDDSKCCGNWAGCALPRCALGQCS